jgi:hypothetical protein
VGAPRKRPTGTVDSIIIQEEGNAVTQHPDTPTSQFTAVRWTFYRRLGLLMRTRLLRDGTTPSLHEVAARTGGHVTAAALTALLAQRALARPDAVLCVKLAQAFDVDPDYFVSDDAVTDYVRSLQSTYAETAPSGGTATEHLTLQAQALALTAAARTAEVATVSNR